MKTNTPKTKKEVEAMRKKIEAIIKEFDYENMYTPKGVKEMASQIMALFNHVEAPSPNEAPKCYCKCHDVPKNWKLTCSCSCQPPVPDKEWEPTAQDLISPEFNAVWKAIKDWDIQRKSGQGYAHATGTDVMIILKALKPLLLSKDQEADRRVSEAIKKERKIQEDVARIVREWIANPSKVNKALEEMDSILKKLSSK